MRSPTRLAVASDGLDSRANAAAFACSTLPAVFAIHWQKPQSRQTGSAPAFACSHGTGVHQHGGIDGIAVIRLGK